MTKKTVKPQEKSPFFELRKLLPRNYMQKLLPLLPDLAERRIRYAFDTRCQDLDLQEKVAAAMKSLAKKHEKRRKKIEEIATNAD